MPDPLIILGSYPILNSESKNTNVDGIEFANYVFTVPTTIALDNTPATNSEYYGPITSTTGSSFVAKPQTGSDASFRVTSTSVENLPGGLSQISVQTAGSSDAEAVAPRVRVITNYPLIFGLGPSTSIVSPSPIAFGSPSNPSGSVSQFKGAGLDTGGFGVMVNFITDDSPEKEWEIFQTYPRKIMPSSIRGVPLPTPTRSPFVQTGGNTPAYTFSSGYNGFICKSTTFQKIGGVILWELTYSESGYFVETSCEGTGENAQCTQNIVYDFTK